MRSVFTKILLWFLLTVFVTFGLTFYLSSVFLRARQPEFNRLAFELGEAREAWETGKGAGLEDFLGRFRDATGADAALTDANGRDILTGRNWAKEIQSSAPGRGYFAFRPFLRIENNRRNFLVVTLSRDRKYYF